MCDREIYATFEQAILYIATFGLAGMGFITWLVGLLLVKETDLYKWAKAKLKSWTGQDGVRADK